jgi:DNA repair protein SbcC/Rad50
MIPVRLKLRNFMCYRDNVPPLDFTGIHLACISGDNGNGKSAIIDAMTWALWGEARAKSVDDLIHTTQSEMEVEFDFTVAGQLYRIIRKRSRPKKSTGAGQSSLELQISGGNGFRAITGNTILQTQQKIIDTLHMKYDTFINSAYLRQGHADEFTRQDPAKRKEVLGDILGLSQYDELEEKAKELTKKHEADGAQLESSIGEINGELDLKPTFEAELAQAQAALSRIEAATQQKESQRNNLRQKKESMELKKAQLEELEGRIQAANRDLQRREEQAGQHLSRINEYETTISRRVEIEDSYSKYEETKKACEELDRQDRQTRALEKQKGQFEARIEKGRNELTTEHTVTRREIGNLEAKAAKLPELKVQLGRTQTQIQKLAENDAALRAKEQAVQEAQGQVSRLEAEKTRLECEIGEAKDKLDLIATHLESHTEAKCPLCEQGLTCEGLKRVESKYAKEKQDKSEQLSTTQSSLVKKRMEAESLQRDKRQYEAGLNQEKTKLQSQSGIIAREIGDIEEEEKRLAGLTEELGNIEQRMVSRDFAKTEQAALGEVEAELNRIGYDAVKHEDTRQLLSQLEPYERDKRKLDEAARLIEHEKEGLDKAREEVEAKRQGLKTDTQRKESITIELATLPQVSRELGEAEAEYRGLTDQRSQAQQTLGSVRARLKRLEELEVKKQEKQAQLTQLSREGSVYRELARAFGKTGIQALIIDTALPEIESEANKLLSRMTDNRMHVKFETQKLSKKGTVQETLDIAIADELGTRNYEMYSGGEAFRINFAIRIALSRLLARRAGAPLPTLIIDEGFGTQDSTGMEKVKEAIISIQDDFEKILVITHMDELKDAFPSRIDVTKTPDGSMITVN